VHKRVFSPQRRRELRQSHSFHSVYEKTEQSAAMPYDIISHDDKLLMTAKHSSCCCVSLQTWTRWELGI